MKDKNRNTENRHLNPYARLLPKFDEYGLAMFPVADPGEMVIRVADRPMEEQIR